jgi:tetratricopeptide (TPR) repeat protein
MLTGGARVAPARQTSLKACIDWSFDLLDEREQLTLGRVAVFVGGFDLAAAESVVPRPGRRVLVVDSIGSLVDQSLVQLDATGRTARYRMLETVRRYALDRLRELGADEERDARSAHAAYFLDLAENAAPSFVGDGHLAWKIRMDADHENLRAAFVTMLADPDPTGALRLGVALSRFWNSRGLYGEETELLESALARPHDGLAPTLLGAALNAVGYLLYRQGATAQAQLRLDEALRMADQVGSDALKADALRTLAWVAARRGRPDEAIRLASQAIDAALASGESHLISRAYDVRAAASHHHDPAGARADYSEALRHGRAAGDAMGQASALNNLAILELGQGDHHAAQRLFREAQVLTEEIRDASLHPFINYGIGVTAVFDEDTLVARRAFADAWHGARESGQRSLMPYALLGLGVVHVLDGRVEPGAMLLGASSALFEQLGEQPEQIEAALYARTVDLARRQLGEAADRAIAAGGRLPAVEVARLVTDTAPAVRPKVQTLNLGGSG